MHGMIFFRLQELRLFSILKEIFSGGDDMREINDMRGLSLARAFFASCEASLDEHIPDIMAVAAIGLAGEGSECFGCDDEISRDHDWGPVSGFLRRSFPHLLPESRRRWLNCRSHLQGIRRACAPNPASGESALCR